MTTTAGSLAEQYRGILRGDSQIKISGAQSLRDAGPHDVSFVDSGSRLRDLSTSHAGAVFVGKKLSDSIPEDAQPSAIILVDDAKSAFIEVLKQFRPQESRRIMGVSDQAYVDPSAKIGENTNVLPGASIDEHAVIGSNCDIHSGVRIGSGCVIGDDVILYPNVVLYPDMTLGSRVIIHAGAVIGADGFGFEFRDGRFVKIPQLGSVCIGDDVEIGACTTIDRGMIGPTTIGEGTKLDNLIMIAHNCELGRHNAYASQVGFAGSVTTGEYVRCAGQVGVAGHVHLADGCTLAAKSGIQKNVPAGETYFGIPARRVAEQGRMIMAQIKFPEMRKQLRELQVQVQELTAKLQHLSDSDDKSAAA